MDRSRLHRDLQVTGNLFGLNMSHSLRNVLHSQCKENREQILQLSAAGQP